MKATQRLVSTLHANATFGYCQPLPPAGRNVKLVILYVMRTNWVTELTASVDRQADSCLPTQENYLFVEPEGLQLFTDAACGFCRDSKNPVHTLQLFSLKQVTFYYYPPICSLVFRLV
jgi:hypothetical protein